MTRSPKITAQLNRLRVFNATKAFMEQHARAPAPYELNIEDLGPQTVARHLAQLDGADGLPYRTVTGRTAGRVTHDDGRGESPGRLARALAVDEVINGGGEMLRAAGFSRRDVFWGTGI